MKCMYENPLTTGILSTCNNSSSSAGIPGIAIHRTSICVRVPATGNVFVAAYLLVHTLVRPAGTIEATRYGLPGTV